MEYCDLTFKSCLPLSNEANFKNCGGGVTSSGSGNDVRYGSPYCMSCLKNETFKHLRDGEDITNNIPFQCLASDQYRCGKPYNSSCIRADDGAACVLGKCSRDSGQISSAISWQAFLDVNPESTVLPVTSSSFPSGFAKPASGCSFDATAGIPTGWANYYVARYVRSFFTCISLVDSPFSWANYSIVTYETFANKSSRDVICNGKEGMCTSSFCDDLYANTTKYTPSFCGALETGLGELKRCMRDYRIAGPRRDFTGGYLAQFVKTTTVRSEDYDYTFGLRQQCLSTAYSDNQGALLTNTAVFVKCPILPSSVTTGAKFYIKNGQFSNSLGWSDKGARACVAVYGAASTVSMGMVGVMVVMMSTLVTSV